MTTFQQITLASLIIICLAGCSGSDTYRGSWKAMNMDGTKFDLLFDEKSFTVTDSTGKVEKFEYTQNSVNIENSVKTYGIRLGDGRSYEINFPIATNENIGLIKDGSSNPIFTICRDEYMEYDEIFKLN